MAFRRRRGGQVDGVGAARSGPTPSRPEPGRPASRWRRSSGRGLDGPPIPLRSGRCDRPEEVTLVVVAADDAQLRTATLALAPRLDQERFSGRARETLPWADRVTAMTPFAVVADGAPVGFGILDTTELHLLALTPRPDSTVLLRSFYVDAAHQGRGIGRRAAAAVGVLARDVAPHATLVVLTVDEHNPIAAHTYRSAGFVDDGDRYLGGTLGPQHILRLPLPPRTD